MPRTSSEYKVPSARFHLFLIKFIRHAEWKAARAREQEEKEDIEFPDETDTPMEIPARERFARYRGLRSFRTSPWDPFENLPLDYSRIFQFEDYEKTKRNVRRRAGEEGVQVGNQSRSDRPQR